MNVSVTKVATAVAVAGLSAGLLWPVAKAAAQTPARQMPVFEVDKGWPKMPPNMKLGDVSAIAVDAQDNAWLLSRPKSAKLTGDEKAAPAIMVFDPAGNYIKGWGGPGAGYEWPEREHSIYVDYKGFVWINGNYCRTLKTPGLKQVSDDQVLKFTQDGKFVMQLGHSDQSKGNADTTNFNRPADMRVVPQTNELFVADGYGNNRIAVYDPDNGKFKRMWGAFGKPPQDVAGASECGVARPKTFEGEGPANFNTVHAIRIANDGLVYVADRENRRLQMFTMDGKFIKQLAKYDDVFARDLAFSTDKDQQFLYTGYAKGIAVIDRKTLEYVGLIQPPGILGTGHQIENDSKGNLYIAGPQPKMQRLLFKGMAPAK